MAINAITICCTFISLCSFTVLLCNWQNLNCLITRIVAAAAIVSGYLQLVATLNLVKGTDYYTLIKVIVYWCSFMIQVVRLNCVTALITAVHLLRTPKIITRRDSYLCWVNECCHINRWYKYSLDRCLVFDLISYYR